MVSKGGVMAAHALTIAYQIFDRVVEYERGKRSADDVVRFAELALDAPGLDSISNPSLRLGTEPGTDPYTCLYCATNGLVDSNGVHRFGIADADRLPVVDRVEHIMNAVLGIMRACRHLRHYRTLEAVQSAFRTYVKRGAPYWRKRRGTWDRWDDTMDRRPPRPEACYQ
jgi:hypothetical protein